MQKTYLKDYRPPDYWVDSVTLDFELDPARTIVTARLDVRRSLSATRRSPLVLDGVGLELIAIRLDGAPLDPSRYDVAEKTLTIRDMPAAAILETEVAISPEANTSLNGLYISGPMFCTQCEAEGFRCITYYPDRPDVLAKFRVRMSADKARYPVLLANGNPVASGDLGMGRHFAEWEDPFPKPAYLFALVAGDLAAVEDSFVTRSGREVALRVFVQRENADKCAYTLDALKRAMRWDEEAFGREYDLDIFMIVAVDHFNFGAMENKGLNIFNSAYVLASPETATDADYEAIESIVAHEYFHNWSGNRVTCRDWFQLCLKEGFTVFRDQAFSADQRSAPMQRIKEVRRLWANQFPEDAGPLAHPPRPDSFITIDNFYTATVYEKGAEVVRMLKRLLGPEKFRAACDLYFSRHDGEAATVEDFARAMEDASGVDLAQFRRWWTDAGTPAVSALVETLKSGETMISLAQSTKPTPGQPEKPPRVIPLDYAVIGRTSGKVLKQETVRFDDEAMRLHPGRFDEPVAVSLFRDFSAPVNLDMAQGLDDRLAILAHETDLFSRWAVADRLWKELCLAFAGDAETTAREETLARFAGALKSSLGADPAFAAEALRAPTEAELAQAALVIDPGALAAARRAVRARVGDMLKGDLAATAERLRDNAPYSPDAASAGRRSLKNACLSLLAAAGDTALAEAQAASAANMTDEAAAMSIMAQTRAPARAALLERFYARWKANNLVVNKWLGWRALQPGEDALADIAGLLDHEGFDIKTPNKVRAVLGVFAHANLEVFHRPDGAGYDFFAEKLLVIDKLNPQLAARLVSAFESWRRLEPVRRARAEATLKAISETKNISGNLYEMATRLVAE